MSLKSRSSSDLVKITEDKVVVVLPEKKHDNGFVQLTKNYIEESDTSLIITNDPDQKNITDIYNSEMIRIGSFIPKRLFGACETFMFILRYIYLVIWCLFFFAKIKPSYVITDNICLCSDKIKSMFNYRVLTTEIMRDKWSKQKIVKRRCRSMTRLTRTKDDHEIYEQEFYDIRSLIRELPDEYRFFCAFGSYSKEYNFNLILTAFYYFMEKNEERLSRPVFLVIGGRFDENNTENEDVFDSLRHSYDYGYYRYNVILLKNPTKPQKRAVLMFSYAMLHANVEEKKNDDIKMALTIGTPVITAEKSCAVENIVFSFSGYIIPLLAKKFAVYMDNVTYKESDMNYYSKRLYLKKFTRTKKVLNKFDEEDDIKEY